MESDPLFLQLKSLLGGADQVVFLWHDTAQKWFKPCDPFRQKADYDDIAAKKESAATDDYVKSFCQK